MMKSEILLQTNLAQEDIHDMDSKTQTDSKVTNYIKKFYIFTYDE